MWINLVEVVISAVRFIVRNFILWGELVVMLFVKLYTSVWLVDIGISLKLCDQNDTWLELATNKLFNTNI